MMKLRLVSRSIVLVLVAVIGIIIVVHDRLDASAPAATLQGTSLGGTQAPAFSLMDQSGTQVSLGALRGHPVVLAFLYTHCPDECPLTAEKFRAAVQALGPSAANVSWIAISTDPVGDTPATATAFVAQHHLTGRLHFLLGTHDQLASVWKAYGVVVQPGGEAASGTPLVTHSLGVYILDSQGRERVFLDSSFDPATLAADLRILSQS
jgi:protein SCO1/2